MLDYSPPPIKHLLRRVEETEVKTDPYAHLYITDCFYGWFYRDILAHLPEPEQMKQIGEVRGGGKLKRYRERFCAPVGEGSFLRGLDADRRKFWRDFVGALTDGKFGRLLIERFGLDSNRGYRNNCYLVRDDTGYALGPHTDTPRKAVAAIFYLPADKSRPDLGTSMYVPKDPTFTDPTGEHLERDSFDLVATMPAVPNSCFAFRRTDSSFHGVEKVDGTRWCLLYDIQYV